MPRIYSKIESHTCDYGVDFINGVAVLPNGADTSYFAKKEYDIDSATHELTALDLVPKDILLKLAEEMELTISETITKRFLVLALNTAIATATETACTITYDKGNESASGSAPTETDKYIGDVITLKANTFTYTGNKFVGWKIGDVVYKAGDKVTVAGNTTITAQWEKAE